MSSQALARILPIALSRIHALKNRHHGALTRLCLASRLRLLRGGATGARGTIRGASTGGGQPGGGHCGGVGAAMWCGMGPKCSRIIPLRTCVRQTKATADAGRASRGPCLSSGVWHSSLAPVGTRRVARRRGALPDLLQIRSRGEQRPHRLPLRGVQARLPGASCPVGHFSQVRHKTIPRKLTDGAPTSAEVWTLETTADGGGHAEPPAASPRQLPRRALRRRLPLAAALRRRGPLWGERSLRVLRRL